MRNPDDTFEPSADLMCDDLFEGYHCTRTHDHLDDHVAHGGHPLRVQCSWPQVRLSDVLNGPDFPSLPRGPLGDAVLADAMERLRELTEAGEEKRQRQAQIRAAKEITAAHADPHWLDEH